MANDQNRAGRPIHHIASCPIAKPIRLDAVTGAVKWTAPTGGYLDWNTPALANGVVYVASVDGEAYAFDAVTGARLWQVTHRVDVVGPDGLYTVYVDRSALVLAP